MKDKVSSNLEPKHHEAIEENRERFERIEKALESIIDVVEKIVNTGQEGEEREGLHRVAEFIELRELAMLNILRTEDLGYNLQISSKDAARILKESIFVDDEGKLQLSFPTLEGLIEKLGEKRRELIMGFQRSGDMSDRPIREIAEGISRDREVDTIPEAEIKGLNPKRDKDAYIATTRGGSTELGKRAVQSVVTHARREIGEIAENRLIRMATYYQIIFSSLIRLYEETKTTHEDMTAMFSEDLSDEEQNELFETFNLPEREKAILELAKQLMQRMEFILEMIEEEKGTDHILARLIPSEKLAGLRRRLQEKMPEGPAKEKAIRIINEAIERRKRIKRIEDAGTFRKRMGGAGTKTDDDFEF